MKDIGVLPWDRASTAITINDAGTAVGASLDAQFNPRATVVANGAMKDLNSVLASNPGKLYLLLAGSVNSRGEIVGLAVDSSGTPHGFLAVPGSPENDRSAFETAPTPAALSPDVRKMVFRRLGIRER